ncbi:DUF4336 domain-containing protein [Pseudodonghicola xiamenensis]|uniref:DUF4336 domain-containing protein n=1 Tax=Pseudodonghicola xiamenensis TaxID=337702 RepID=A0A8J3MBU7_9RHOB|nr:DUF4336 domain-containing protein [Pseudodonghicola xiamenensis]GHG87412.1 hypothetical protein GCM10010961_15830 [Pseudodonghicola xiamenensis]
MTSSRATGYEPLLTLKPVARDLWIVDGPAIGFYHLPFSTRATVVRLRDGGLWVHSPVRLSDPLRAEIAALGPVRHLVAPNWIHYAFVADWQAAFPEATSWAAPGVIARAADHDMKLRFDHELTGDAPPAWDGEIDQTVVKGSKVHHEAVFFHRASRTLILTDLIENFEPRKLPWWMRPLVRLAGISAPRGHMPPDMRATFDKALLGASVRQMLDWGPERVILAHGACYESGGSAELRRAFGFALS